MKIPMAFKTEEIQISTHYKIYNLWLNVNLLKVGQRKYTFIFERFKNAEI